MKRIATAGGRWVSFWNSAARNWKRKKLQRQERGEIGNWKRWIAGVGKGLGDAWVMKVRAIKGRHERVRVCTCVQKRYKGMSIIRDKVDKIDNSRLVNQPGRFWWLYSRTSREEIKRRFRFIIYLFIRVQKDTIDTWKRNNKKRRNQTDFREY